jgi:hypothetical protein
MAIEQSALHRVDGAFARWNFEYAFEWGHWFDLAIFNPFAGLGSTFWSNTPWLNPGALALQLPFFPLATVTLSYLNRRPLHRKPRYVSFALVMPGTLADELFPGKGAATTGGATGTRQIICRKGPERGCQTRFGTFAGKSQASFGQLPVILGDQHCVLPCSRWPTAAGVVPFEEFCLAGGIIGGGVLIQRASAAPLVTLLNRVRP